jgi:hypothetical protein
MLFSRVKTDRYHPELDKSTLNNVIFVPLLKHICDSPVIAGVGFPAT